MAVIVAIHTKTASKLSYIDIIHCFEASLFTTTIGTQYDDYRNHTTTNKSSPVHHTSERTGTTVAQTDVMSKAITINYHLSTPLGYTFRVGLFRAPEGTSPSPCVRKDSDIGCMCMNGKGWHGGEEENVCHYISILNYTELA